MRAPPPASPRPSTTLRRATLPLAALLGVLAAATLAVLLIAQGNPDGTHAPPALDLPLAILASEAQDIDALPARNTATTTDVRVARYLGTVDDRRYFAAVRNDGDICLIADDGASTVVGCRQPETFARSGQSLSLAGPETAFSAFLLPDGYATAAAALPWATLVGDNLLVVTDPPAAARLVNASLPADAPGDPPLDLVVLG